MNILILCNDTRYLVDHRSNIVSALISEGHRVSVVAGGDPSYSAQLPGSVKYIYLPLLRHRFSLIRDMYLIGSYVRLIKRLRPDVVHTISIKPNLYGAIALKVLATAGNAAPRLVMTFPGLGKVFEPYTTVAARLRKWLVAKNLRMASRSLDYCATFENDADSDYLTSLGVLEAGRCHSLLGAGIDLNLFRSRSSPRSGAPAFLFASRLIRAKGIDTYIAAAKLLRSQGSKAEFLVAGPDDPGNPDNYGLEYVREAEAQGIIRYVGNFPASEMASVLEQADILCLPTRLREGLPRILIEAAANGCAIIASAQPASRSILPSPQCGWLVENPTTEAIAAAMREAEANSERTRATGLTNATFIRSQPVGDACITARFIALYRDSRKPMQPPGKVYGRASDETIETVGLLEQFDTSGRG